MPFDIDLDEMMRESVEAERSDTQEGAGEGSPSAVATPSAEAAPVTHAGEAESPLAPETGERPRGPDGKFVKADEGKPAETGKQPENQTPAAAQTGEPQPITDQAVTQGIQAPVSWSAAAKAEFSKLPIAVQEAVAKREMEVSNGFKQYGEKVKQYEAIDKILEPLTP